MKETSKEFEFFANRLKEIASCIASTNYASASFMIGCLHSIALQNAENYKKDDKEL